MKRYMSFVLAAVLVLGLAAVTSAAGAGTLKGQSLSATIDVSATIGPYAKITAGRPVQFGELLGKVGLYTANDFDATAEQFYHRAAEVFGLVVDENLFVSNNDGGWGSFYIESNCDVLIQVEFDDKDWLESPTLFGIAKAGEPDVVKAWAAANFDLVGYGKSFVHEYQKREQLYGINGAIWIRSISDQKADSYSGVLTITVTKN